MISDVEIRRYRSLIPAHAPKLQSNHYDRQPNWRPLFHYTILNACLHISAAALVCRSADFCVRGCRGDVLLRAASGGECAEASSGKNRNPDSAECQRLHHFEVRTGTNVV